MYRLKVAASPAALIDLDPRSFSRDLDGPPSLLVVQSSVMQQWLKHQLAVSLGLAFLPPMMVPEKAFRYLLSWLSPPSGARPEALFMDDLILLCYRELQEIRRQIGSKSPESRILAETYEPVLSWMGFSLKAESGSQEADERELVRIHQADQLFTLANECAGVLFSYAQNPLVLPDGADESQHDSPLSEPGILEFWESGRTGFVHRAAAAAGMGSSGMVLRLQAHETWQAHLFARLGLGPGDGSPSAPVRQTSVLGLLMARAMRENWTWKGPTRRIVLFGSAFLSRQAFDFLHWLGRSPGPGLDVDHFLYLPGQEARSSSLADSWSRLGTDLLDHMKRKGVEVQDSPAPPPVSTDLQRLRALCDGKDVQGTFTGDGSFRILAGPGMGREISALKSMILEELADPASSISCRDILVLAPDIGPWRPWIEAAFGPPGGEAGSWRNRGGTGAEARGTGNPQDPGFPLPWNMTDLRVQGNSTYLSALRMLLDLGRSRWERPELFTLLDNRCFHSRHSWGNREREDFLRFADRAMIRWGLDASHRSGLGGGSSESQSWNSGFEKFCLALPLHKDTELDERDDLAAYGQTEASGFASVFQILHEIAARFRSWKKRTCSLDVWIQLHRSLMEEFLTAPEKEDQDHAEAALSTLNNLSNLLRPGREEMAELKLDWFTFLRFFQDQLDQVEDGLGQHLSNGITFSSLRPWRAISFPLIVVLGMNEGEFPRVDSPQAFDLAMLPALADHAKPGSGRLMGGRPDTLTQDNYAWLETLHAATNKLWVFHHGRDPHSGKKREPSSMIAWIQLNMNPGDRQKIEYAIPIQDLGPGANPALPGEQFRFEDALRSGILQGRISAPPKAGTSPEARQPGGAKPVRKLGMNELARIFSHPLRGHAKFTLGIEARGSEDRRDSGEETLSPAYLQKRSWMIMALEGFLSGTASMDADTILSSALRENRLQPGSLSGLARTGLKASLEHLHEGRNQVMEFLGRPVQDNLEPAEDWWPPLELPDGQTWVPTAGNVQAWKTPGGTCACLAWSDKKMGTIMQGRHPNKTKLTDNKKILPLVFELLPAVLAHGLGSRHDQPALVGVLSGNPGSAQESVICMIQPWGGELRRLVLDHMDLILGQPLALYPGILADLLDASMKGESLEDAWAAWQEEFRDDEQEEFTKKDSSSDRADKPGSCPYFPLFFREIPEWNDSIRMLVENFYKPLVQKVWGSVLVGSGSSAEGEN